MGDNEVLVTLLLFGCDLSSTTSRKIRGNLEWICMVEERLRLTCTAFEILKSRAGDVGLLGVIMKHVHKYALYHAPIFVPNRLGQRLVESCHTAADRHYTRVSSVGFHSVLSRLPSERGAANIMDPGSSQPVGGDRLGAVKAYLVTILDH